MSTFYEFTKDKFPSLTMQRYTGQWNSVGLDDLERPERFIITMFFKKLTNGALELEDPNNVLLVKASGQFFNNVYGPSVSATDTGELMVTIGNNHYPIDMSGEDITIGEFNYCFFDVATINTAAGKSFVKAHFNLTSDNDNAVPQSYKIPCRLRADIDIQEAMLRRALDKKKDFAKYFLSAGEQSGNDTGKLQELGDGNYTVVGTETVEINGRDGKRNSHILTLEDGRKFWCRGDASIPLEAGYVVSPDSTCTLVIFDTEKKGDKTYMKTVLLPNKKPFESDTLNPEEVPF